MDFDKNKYKVWKLPNWMLLHWVLNPGLAFNELVLGQRIPKVTLIDKQSDAPLMERQYIPCPHCKTIHNGLLWSKKNALGNWFGYLCPNCHEIIPCLWNVTSLVLLTLTFPIWGWFKKPLKNRWLTKKIKLQQETNNSEELPKAENTSWLKMGLTYGIIMFCVMSLPKIISEDVSYTYIVTQFSIWLAAGLAFGGIMKLFLGRSKNV
ncbi:hypothetical protein [Marinomonas sp. 2405UD68-3]|uniref:hypothetical protein n=1 Tax=Marinomonas sp. 2405UD68-3 TaxID=3391835 RepID=UPI0039C9D0CD